jgi:hypothetical protein
VQILAVTARIIQKDAEEKKVSFNPRPYFRLFINWLNELTTSDLHHDGANFQVYMYMLLILYVKAVSHFQTCLDHYLMQLVFPGFDRICKCIPYSATLESSSLEVCYALLIPLGNFLISLNSCFL